MDGLYEQARIALHQVWRRRWLALGVAWGVCLAGWLVVALIPSKYESTARVFVQMQSVLPNQIGITSQERQNDLTRLRQTLVSTANLEKVVRRTELNQLVASDRDVAAQVEKLKEAIGVTAQQDNLFEISASANVRGFSNAQNARLAHDIVKTLLDLFVAPSGNRDEATQGIAFLDDELKRREADLQAAEQKRVAFEQQYLGLLPGEGSVESRLAGSRAELSNVESQLVQAQSSLAALRGQLNSTPATLPGLGGTTGGPVTAQIEALQAQLAQAAARGWTESHPDVIALRAQIARLKPLAARESPNAGGISNPSYVSLKTTIAEKEGQVQAALARRAQLQADLAQLGSKQASAPGVAAQQAQLNRDYDVLKRQYDKLVEDREQLRLRNDVQAKTASMTFRVIDPPSLPTIPLSPKRPLLLTAILLLGLGAGVGAAFVKGQLQATFPTQNRLAAATGLPVLGTVTEVWTEARRRLARQRLVWLAGGAGALGAAYAVLMAVEFWQRSTVA